jgi:hypothetical protein
MHGHSVRKPSLRHGSSGMVPGDRRRAEQLHQQRLPADERGRHAEANVVGLPDHRGVVQWRYGLEGLSRNERLERRQHDADPAVTDSTRAAVYRRRRKQRLWLTHEREHGAPHLRQLERRRPNCDSPSTTRTYRSQQPPVLQQQQPAVMARGWTRAKRVVAARHYPRRRGDQRRLRHACSPAAVPQVVEADGQSTAARYRLQRQQLHVRTDELRRRLEVQQPQRRDMGGVRSEASAGCRFAPVPRYEQQRADVA